MQDDRTEKQQFLRDEVIEVGYDPSDFVDYLVSIKQDGQNIDLWTLGELKEQVRKFKELIGKRFEVVEEIKPSQQQEKEEAGHSLQNLTQTLFQREEKLKPVVYDKYNAKDRELKRKVKCIQFRPYVSRDMSAFRFAVEKPEVKVTGGLLGFGGINQIWYTVRSNLIESEFKREDEDFEWLRKTLHRFYPAHFIPPLRRTKPFLPEDLKSLDKRMLMIRAFLQALLKQPLMFNTKLLLNFFSISEYPKFQRFKQEINTVGFVKVLSNLQTESGVAELQISTQNQQALKAAGQYVNQVDDKYNSMKVELRNFMRHLDDSTSSLYKLANNFADLQKLQSELSNDAPQLQVVIIITKNSQLTDLFIDINNFLIEWGRNFQQKKKSVEKHLGVFFKYAKQENEAMKDLLKRRADTEEQYIKFKLALEKRKQKVYPDVTKWEIPKNVLSKLPEIARMPKEQLLSYLLPKETEKMGRMREWTAYQNKTAETEFIRLLPLIVERYREKFKALRVDLAQAVRSEVKVVEKLQVMG